MDSQQARNRQEAHWKTKLGGTNDLVEAVGSESLSHKRVRYENLARVFGAEQRFSVLDIGCGVGHFADFLDEQFSERDIEYAGSDITPDYVRLASERRPDRKFVLSDILSENDLQPADYVILSGIFHQRGTINLRDWYDYMTTLLLRSWSLARRGLAFNVLSQMADHYHPDNYYPSSLELLSLVQRRMSRFVQVDATTPLFEDTFIIYRSAAVRGAFPNPEFFRYLRADLERDEER